VPLAADVRIGVLGAGAMGAGIAQVAAAHGHIVSLVDADGAALDRARSAIDAALAREVEKGRLPLARAADVLARIRVHPLTGPDGMGVFAGCGLVIEAIVERLDVKRDAFARLERAVTPEAVLATNTSSLPIAAIASACSHPERVLGAHFFNPAPVLPLVEIVPWMGTAPTVTADARALIERWGKVPVLAADTPGFIVNRVARPFYGEALRIHDEGIADVATIDWAMRERGFRMGPFELMDFIGNDVNFAVTSTIFAALFHESRFRPSLTQQRLVEAGRLGRKTGRGFYEYRAGTPAPAPTTDPALGERIAQRILSMLINEAIDAVHWRVASPADIDLAVVKGVNYPKGLLAWGEELGLDRVLASLTDLQTEYGEERYRPSVLLKRVVREGRRLT
jgi:3-hydroxybutyryl-CoA dehydrogenase